MNNYEWEYELQPMPWWKTILQPIALIVFAFSVLLLITYSMIENKLINLKNKLQ